LLQTRDDTVEQHLGVSAGNKFRNVDDMSDDEEADMSLDSDNPNDAADDRKHKTARKQSSTVADGNSVPKWSNPEQYTALPPPAETTGKKIDFVKLIRKAKNDAAGTSDANNAVAANDDFIGFDNDGESADQPIVFSDGVPQASSRRNAINGQSVAGSMNEATSSASSGALRESGRNSKRSAADAALPPRPQHPEGYDATRSEARSEPGRSSKRSATDAGLPSRSQYSDRSSKRSRVTPATMAMHWMPVAGQDSAPWIYMDGQVAEHYARLANQPSSL
jgi:non-canonical poly(A) RNA polymerase PAPD5/7